LIIKKVETSFAGGTQGHKKLFRCILRFRRLFCQPAATTKTKLAEKVYFGVLQHPVQFQAEILTRNLHFEKNQKFH